MSDPKEITVLDGRVRLLQPEGGYHTSIDAVFLAAACPAQKGDSLMDLGCGVGAAGLCVLERIPEAHLTGIDIQEGHIALAYKNAALNNKEAVFIAGDIRKYIREYKGETFNHIICNPPFLADGTHVKSPDESRATALGHEDTTLECWITAAFNLIKGQGSLTIIHRADHMDEIVTLLKPRFGGIEIIPLWPKENTQAKRVIIRCAKHSHSPATLYPGLVLHDEGGKYTEETEEILRNAKAL